MKALFRRFVLLCGAAGLIFVMGFAASGAKPQGRQQSLLDRPQASAAQLAVLDRLLGTWDVRVKVLAPQPGTVTYSETYEWVLDRQFLRGETTVKSDGTKDLSMTTYDAAAGGYHLWIFNSKGTAVELLPGIWDARSQSMEWKSGPNTDITFSARWTFPDANSRTWTARLKDWKGHVLLDLEGTCRRRR